jgi:hypothetical protein
MSTLCSVCNHYPCPGCLGAANDEIDRLRARVKELEAQLKAKDTGVRFGGDEPDPGYGDWSG